PSNGDVFEKTHDELDLEFLPKSSIVTPFSGPPNPSSIPSSASCDDKTAALETAEFATITLEGRKAMSWFRERYMYYSYCYDNVRYPVPLLECVIVHSEWHLFKDTGRLKQALKMKFSHHQNYHRRSSRQKSRVPAAAASGPNALSSKTTSQGSSVFTRMPQVGLTPQGHQARHKSLHSAKLTSSKVLAQLRFMSSRCLATQQYASEGPQLSRQANVACWVFKSIPKCRRVKHASIDAYWMATWSCEAHKPPRVNLLPTT
ncbi:hypothetical protein HYC85_022996, partial [Camellia sinensis]